MVAVAKALADSARETKVLDDPRRRPAGPRDHRRRRRELAKLPPLDVAARPGARGDRRPADRSSALFSAPLQNLFGLIDARIEQLEAGGDTSGAAASEPEAQPEPETAAEPEAPAEEPAAEVEAEAAPGAEAEAEAGPEAVAETATQDESTVEEDAEASTSENQEEE